MPLIALLLIVPALGMLALALTSAEGYSGSLPVPLLLLGALVGMGILMRQLFPSPSPVSKDLPGDWDEIKGGGTVIDEDTAVVHTDHGHFLVHRNFRGTGMIEVNEAGNLISNHWTYGTDTQIANHIKLIVNKRARRR